MKIHVHVLICNTYHAHVVVIVTARKRSLGQGNAFTSVLLFGGGCLPLGSRWGGVSASGSGGGSASGSRAGVSSSGSRGVTPLGHSLWTHTCALDTDPPDTYTPWTHTPRHTPTPLLTGTHTLDTPPPRALAIEAGSTHPTGIHSCCLFFHFFNSNFLSGRSLKIS